MEIMANKKEILTIFKEQIEILKNELIASTQLLQKGYFVYSHAVMNDSGVFVAYLSCGNDSVVESLELILNVTFEENVLLIETDIYLTDGSVVREFGITRIEWIDLDQMKQSLDNFFKRLTRKELNEYALIVMQLGEQTRL